MYQRREHAGYFRGKSKEYKERDELFVVEKLIESMETVGEGLYHSPNVSVKDPPDCTAKDASGNCIAFEVTELVDESSVALASQGTRIATSWELKELIGDLVGIMKEKDAIDYGHREYSSTILIICTDEYTLNYK